MLEFKAAQLNFSKVKHYYYYILLCADLAKMQNIAGSNSCSVSSDQKSSWIVVTSTPYWSEWSCDWFLLSSRWPDFILYTI